MILTDKEINRQDWRKSIEEVEYLFINNSLPDVSVYDANNINKINRECLFPIKRDKKYIQSRRLSDHKMLSKKNFYTWNTLHHYSYNTSHEYLSDYKIKNKLIRARGVNGLIPEEIRYDNITQKILSYLKLNDTKCFALQECEFYIYKSLVQQMNNSYICRFIPHKLAYDKHGLYVESYGCALFIDRSNLKNLEVFVQGSKKETHDLVEVGYKYIAIKFNNDVYVSVHFPCFRVDKEKAWIEYFYQDFNNILNCFKNVENYYLLGDFNVSKYKLDILLNNINKNIKVEYEVCGVDYLMKLKFNDTKKKLTI